MLGNIHHRRVVAFTKNLRTRGVTSRPLSPPNHPSVPGFMGSGPMNNNITYFGAGATPPANLAALKASGTYGDSGTAIPFKIASANTATFGIDAVPATLVALKAHAKYGDSGTDAPANGAAANDAAWVSPKFVKLGDNSLAMWNGTAWVVLATNPSEGAFTNGKYVRCADNTKATWNGTAWVATL